MRKILQNLNIYRANVCSCLDVLESENTTQVEGTTSGKEDSDEPDYNQDQTVLEYIRETETTKKANQVRERENCYFMYFFNPVMCLFIKTCLHCSHLQYCGM